MEDLAVGCGEVLLHLSDLLAVPPSKVGDLKSESADDRAGCVRIGCRDWSGGAAAVVS